MAVTVQKGFELGGAEHVLSVGLGHEGFELRRAEAAREVDDRARGRGAGDLSDLADLRRVERRSAVDSDAAAPNVATLDADLDGVGIRRQ